MSETLAYVFEVTLPTVISGTWKII